MHSQELAKSYVSFLNSALEFKLNELVNLIGLLELWPDNSDVFYRSSPILYGAS